jgi:hypothetical protein
MTWSGPVRPRSAWWARSERGRPGQRRSAAVIDPPGSRRRDRASRGSCRPRRSPRWRGCLPGVPADARAPPAAPAVVRARHRSASGDGRSSPVRSSRGGRCSGPHRIRGGCQLHEAGSTAVGSTLVGSETAAGGCGRIGRIAGPVPGPGISGPVGAKGTSPMLPPAAAATRLSTSAEPLTLSPSRMVPTGRRPVPGCGGRRRTGRRRGSGAPRAATARPAVRRCDSARSAWTSSVTGQRLPARPGRPPGPPAT